VLVSNVAIQRSGSEVRTAKLSKPENSGDCMTALSMACRTKVESAAKSSARSMPRKAWKKPIMTTIRSAKKMSDSRIMTFSTTNMAPKKRNVSR
jgi:hypothetical protein